MHKILKFFQILYSYDVQYLINEHNVKKILIL